MRIKCWSISLSVLMKCDFVNKQCVMNSDVPSLLEAMSYVFISGYVYALKEEQ